MEKGRQRSNGSPRVVLTDGSRIITEALVRAGADVYIGYPITPSNLFYGYASKRFPSFYAAPDEISVVQWMSGLSATGKIPVSATSFPGLALMTESLNMAYMMELPMVLVVAQRLGPSTGSATTGAQGDLAFLNGIISGGYPVPVFCPSSFEDCWKLAAKSVEFAIKVRTPVVLLTSKEMVMTHKSFDLSNLEEITAVNRKTPKPSKNYRSYQSNSELVPAFLPLGAKGSQVRMNSSTHDNDGLIRKGDQESLDNTRRLKLKIEKWIPGYTYYEWERQIGAERLLVSYGISADAAREARIHLHNKNLKVDLLIIKTLLPVEDEILEIISHYDQIDFVEENLSGQLKELIFGKRKIAGVGCINKIGSMITPGEILEALI